MTPDLINGLFEFAAGFLLWKSCHRLWKDKQVKGVYVPATVVFTLWGAWNLIYYPALNQPFSFCGGLLVVSANTFWIILALKYRKKNDCIQDKT